MFKGISILAAKARYKIMPKPVLISARKFETNSWMKVQWTNYRIIKMELLNMSLQKNISKCSGIGKSWDGFKSYI